MAYGSLYDFIEHELFVSGLLNNLILNYLLLIIYCCTQTLGVLVTQTSNGHLHLFPTLIIFDIYNIISHISQIDIHFIA